MTERGAQLSAKPESLTAFHGRLEMRKISHCSFRMHHVLMIDVRVSRRAKGELLLQEARPVQFKPLGDLHTIA